MRAGDSSRETRSRRPFGEMQRKEEPAQALAASTQTGLSKTAPASASAAIASPFQAATTLSSRAGLRASPRAASSRRRTSPTSAGVVGVSGQLQRRAAVLEGALPR